MSNPLLDSLIPTKEVGELLEQSIREAKEKLPQIKNYNVGGAFRTLLEIDALLHSELWEFLKEVIARNMFIPTASGKWLDLHGEQYQIKRKPAQKTVGKVVFKRSADGNIKIPKGTVIKTKPDIFGDSLSFITIEEKVLTEDLKEIEITVEAVEEGSRYNVAPYTINTITTYIPVEVENREDWIIQEGADEEDDESLRERILLVWATKTLFVDDYYRYHTLSVDGVIDCYIDNQHPRGQGTADIYIVGTNIIPTDDLLNKVQSVIDEIKTPAADILVKPAKTKPVDIHIQAYTKTGLTEILKEEITRRVKALFVYDKKYKDVITNYENRRFKIGQSVKLATIIDVIMDIPEIDNVKVLTPDTDIDVEPSEVAVINNLDVEVIV